jgi:hypothetical protein
MLEHNLYTDWMYYQLRNILQSAEMLQPACVQSEKLGLHLTNTGKLKFNIKLININKTMGFILMVCTCG